MSEINCVMDRVMLYLYYELGRSECVIRKLLLGKKQEKKPLPNSKTVKRGPLVRDQGLEPWTP